MTLWTWLWLVFAAVVPHGTVAAPARARLGRTQWATAHHKAGTCAMYGVCGKRKDGDDLNCPWNKAAPDAEKDAADIIQNICPSLWAESGGKLCCSGRQAATMQASLRAAEIFIIGCPACLHNFRNLFCTLFCSPDQSTFTNVTAVQRPPVPPSAELRRSRVSGADGADGLEVAEDAVAVKRVAFYLSESFKAATFDSCKDVIFSVANQPAMTYIGDGATTAQHFLDFLGRVKDESPLHVGSPIQLDFPCTAPAAIEPWSARVPTCWDEALKCSCGDCPDAPACHLPPAPAPPPDISGCPAWGMAWQPLSCTSLAVWLPGGMVLLLLCWAACTGRLAAPPRKSVAGTDGGAEGVELDVTSGGTAAAVNLTVDAPLLSSPRPPPPSSPSYLSSDALRALVGRRTSSASGSQSAADAEATTDGLDDGDAHLAPAPRLPRLEAWLRPAFRAHGALVAHAPHATLLASIVLVALLSAGLLFLHVETEPLRLWVPPSSRAARDKAAYDAAFGPFYRIEQLIISTAPGANGSAAPILTDDAIDLVFDIHDVVDGINVTLHTWHNRHERDESVTLRDICYKPFGSVCAVESVAQYWAMDRAKFASKRPSVSYCLSHWSTECRSAFKAPIEPKLVLGGYPTDSTFRSYEQDTTALLLTFPVDASSPHLGVLAWEKAFIQAVESTVAPMVESKGLRLSYSAESSVKSELARESFMDVSTVVASYAAMLLYITVALSKAPPQAPLALSMGARPAGAAGAAPARAALVALLVGSRASLAFGGVGIVFLSVLSALGLCSALGVASTLIVMEVIPFLVLAVGVDNMFILALKESAQPAGMPPRERVASALESAGPSIAFAASSEVVAFLLASATPMPAVRSFALVAAVAVAVDFLLQISAFAALLVLDCERLADGRLDCVPCTRLRGPLRGSAVARGFQVQTSDDGMTSGEVGTAAIAESTQHGSSRALSQLESLSQDDAMSVPAHTQHSNAVTTSSTPRLDIDLDDDDERLGAPGSLAARALLALHARVLAQPWGKLLVLASFLVAALTAASLLPRLDVGLDQSVAIPRDSYLQRYYGDVLTLARVGPPVMFVVEGLNVSHAAPDIDAVCASAGCDDASLLNRIAAGSQRPGTSYLATPAASWLDDLFAWVQPELVDCCRRHSKGEHAGDFCAAPDVAPCATDPAACSDCDTCLAPSDLLPDGRPSEAQIQALLPGFLRAEPSAACAKGGLGIYSSQIETDAATGDVVGLERGLVTSSFRALSAPLSAQSDFIGALASSRAIADEAGAAMRAQHEDLEAPAPRVFAYSIFHPFFEQYLTIRRDAAVLLASAGAAVVAVVALFTGSGRLALLLALTLGSLLLDMLGTMVLAGVQLNAVSLVNLAMSLGIAVEFFAHIAHAFMVSLGSREERIAAAFRDKGAAVFSGIVLTKFVGVATLALSQTAIFQVYYFRMYLALVALGALHAFLLLPVLLVLLGPDELPLVLRWHGSVNPRIRPVTNRSPYIISRNGALT